LSHSHAEGENAMPKTINTALIGLGNVGRSFLRILETKSERIAAQYGLAFRITCVADSSGVAAQTAGFDPLVLRQYKEGGGRVSGLASYVPGRTPAEVLADAPVDLVLEASPVNLQDGEPGLSAVRTTLSRGIAAVLANKGPLVLAFAELQALAKANNASLAYSATVCGALPVINIGRRDLVAADVSYLAGIFNSTSNFILGEMAAGRAYTDALAEAQQRGLAETDPRLDVEGWDTANKLVIVANSFLGIEATLADVEVKGITGITAEELQAALAQGSTIKLLAQAEQVPGGYRLSVGPKTIGQQHFLAQCDGWEMGIEIKSDLYGIMYHKIWEREPLPTAAAMLRDAVNVLGEAV
jgi:homoserine dehydrogenase